MNNIPILVFIISIGFLSINCSKILIITPVPSYSHQLFFRPIFLELSKRGHELTIITPNPMPNPPKNIKQIDVNFGYEIRHVKYNTTTIQQEHRFNFFKIFMAFYNAFTEITEKIMELPQVQDLIHNNKPGDFDLIIFEAHMLSFGTFAHYYKCPLIGISSAELSSFFHETFGNPAHPLLYPEVVLPYEEKLNFKNRVVTFGIFILNNIFKVFMFDNNYELFSKYFGPDTPRTSKDITKLVDLVIINTHPVFNLRPLLPGFVQIGSTTPLKPPKELPKELKEFLDSAKEGAIYFSLGTNVHSRHLSDNFRNSFIETFRELPYKVLWKLDQNLTNVPSNVKIVNWTPQTDVLRHPNIKLFISQCGVHSMEEAILSKVPILGIPFVSDQKANANKIQNRDLGIVLDAKYITKDDLKAAIMEVIHNPKYKNNAKYIAEILQDEPMTGLDKAIWWIEYVIRHKMYLVLLHQN